MDLKKIYNPSLGYILLSYQRVNDRSSTGILPSGVEIKFYETLLTDVNYFKKAVKELTAYSGESIKNIAAVSIDAIYCPYSTSYSSGDFPHFINPADTSEPNAITLNPFNPNNSLIGASGNFLPSGWALSGHNIVMASVGDNLGNILTTGVSGIPSGERINPESLIFDLDFYTRGVVEYSSIRPVGLRSPLVMAGWGFDIEGNPVPSDPDDPTKFNPNTFLDPSIWKAGPVDLRWDNNRGVWTGGTQTKIYLVKTTNVYNPSCFSYEVDWSKNKSQYTKTSLAPKVYNTGNFPENIIYDPEYVAYTGNPNNSGCFEKLNFVDVEFPYYEAYIIRETNLNPDSSDIYNIWTEDCHDCGHIANKCQSATQHGSAAANKKILIENPLRQSLDVGDLAFTVYTGRKKQVYSGGFTGGSGVSASGKFVTNSSGIISFVVTNSGSGYTDGAFATYNKPCVGLNLHFSGGILQSGTIVGDNSGYLANQEYPVNIIPKNAIAKTEKLPIHWILQAEFKSQQVVAHVEAQNGILQTVTTKIQTQGFKSCLHAGEDSSLVNNFI